MAAWAIIAVPLLIMFFALGMERVEARLRQIAVGENEVEEFLEQARPNEVRELFRHGIGRALELFRLRRRSQARRSVSWNPPLTVAPGTVTTPDWPAPDTDLGNDVTMPMPAVRAVPATRFRAS
jgi:hypothetical protein